MSLELLRDNEKAEVRKMISVLADYGLSYVPEAAAKGDSGSAGGHSSSLPHILVPEIDQFVGFRVEEESTPRGSVSKKVRRIPSGEFERMVVDRPEPTRRPPFTADLIPNVLRSTVAREIAIEKIRQQESLRAAQGAIAEVEEDLGLEEEEEDECADGEWSVKPVAKASTTLVAEDASSSAAAIVDRCKSSAKAAASTDAAKKCAAEASAMVRKDFFGNIISTTKKSTIEEKTATSSSPKRDAENINSDGTSTLPTPVGKKARKTLKYKFQKGFTNAIRRPVYMSDLL